MDMDWEIKLRLLFLLDKLGIRSSTRFLPAGAQFWRRNKDDTYDRAIFTGSGSWYLFSTEANPQVIAVYK